MRCISWDMQRRLDKWIGTVLKLIDKLDIFPNIKFFVFQNILRVIKSLSVKFNLDLTLVLKVMHFQMAV